MRRDNPIKIACRHPEYFKTLLGTGGTWFLFDIAYYGTAIFSVDLINSIFGSSESVFDICWQGALVALSGVPGVVLAVLLLKTKGARWLNMYGFWLLAFSFAGLGLCYSLKADKWLKFGLYCFLTFGLNLGPNVATFVLPSSVYPAEATKFTLSFPSLSLSTSLWTQKEPPEILTCWPNRYGERSTG